jgi:hypothetical protein
MKNENFICQTEFEDYEKKNRYFKRHGVKINFDGTTEKLTKISFDGDVKNNAIEDVISGLVSNHIKSSSQSKLITVEMYEEDGLSWFSQKLFDINHSVYPHFCFFNFNSSSKDASQLPTIAYEIGVKKFIQSAIKSKICSSEGFKFMPPWLYVSFSIVLTLIVEFVVEVYAPSGNISVNSFFNLRFFFLFIGLACLSALSNFFREKSALQSEAKSIKKFLQQLDEVSMDIQNNTRSNNKNKFDALINDIVEKLNSKELPRFFIIDNFSKLDFVTRSVIKQYWKKSFKESNIQGKEIWIIVESQNNNEKLSTLLIQDKSLTNSIDKFTQLRIETFSDEEKEMLVDICNVDKSCAEFTYARYICNGYAKNQTWILEELNGKDKHLLNFLYLLSIAKVPVNIERIDNILQNECSKNILSIFLDEEYNSLKLKSYNKEITTNFKNLLVGNENRPLKDTYFTMQQNENKLQLSNHKLGHVFWSLYWGEVLKNKPYNVFWVQNISNHLVNCDFCLLPRENNEAYIRLLIDYSIYAIEGNVNFGTLNNIYKLLDITKDLLLYLKTYDKTKYNKFIFLCWQCYILTKNELIVKILVQIANEINETKDLNQDTDISLQLYLELLPINLLGNEQIVNDFSDWLYSYSNADVLIRYMKIQSIWLSLSIAPMNRDFQTMLMANVANQSFSNIEQIYNTIIQNKSTDKSIVVFDLISISVILWVNCLKIYNDIRLHLSSTSQKIDNEFLKKSFANMVDNFFKVITYLEEKELIIENNQNYFEKAIIGEITLTILSALTASYKFIKDSPYYTKKMSNETLLTNINSQIEKINKIIHFDFPNINELDDLSSVYFSNIIEQNYNFQSLIWQKLNLSELYNNLIIKRIQYNAFTKGRDVESIDYNIINSINDAYNKSTQIGVLANVVIANYLEKIVQLSSYYFVQVGDIMIKERFGKNIIKDISLLTIVYFNKYSTDLSRFVAAITEDSNFKQNNNYLSNNFIAIPEEKFFSVLLQLSNSSRKIKDDSISNKFNKLIRSYSENIKSERLKKRSKALFEFIDISDSISKSNSNNALEILKKWADKKHYFMYAAILTQLIENGCSDEIVKKEIIATMKRQPDSGYNSYLHLAIRYANIFLLNNDNITSDEENYIIKFLCNHCLDWEANETSHMNKEMYEILTFFYPDVEIFATKLFYWGLKVSEIEHKQSIPSILEQGHYFLLFKKYTEDMLLYGIQLNMDKYQYRQKLYIEEESKKEKVNEWLRHNNGIPTPIINGYSICSEFLIIGSYFFTRSLINDENYIKYREKFNQMSKQYIMQLVDLILKVPQIPNYYKDIIKDFYSGLQNYKRIKE